MIQRNNISYRAVEGISHDWAKHNPDSVTLVTFANDESKVSIEIQLRSNKRGQLSPASITNLRRAKKLIDKGQSEDSYWYDCYSLTVSTQVEVRA